MIFIIIFTLSRAFGLLTLAAEPGQFPYQVGLSTTPETSSSTWCSGSLITQNWILTSAYCTDNIQSVTVYLGINGDTSPAVKHTVSKSEIIIHPEWNNSTLENDISLVKIPFTDYSILIQPVNLPNITSSYPTYEGEKVIVSSWRRTSDASDVITSLQWAEMAVISNTVCARTYGTIITSSNICVSTPDSISNCQVDSGGPLVLASSKVLIGLTSTSPGCDKGFLAAFSRVTSYLAWIQVHTGLSL